MQHYVLRNHSNQITLFEGDYESYVDCLEDAVTNNINLQEIDLSNKNLSNANLDNAKMQNANFNNSNLTGANLSESNLQSASFNNTTLYNTCLSYSNLKKANFMNANFGATLINGSNIEKAMFSTLSCFDLDFRSVEKMKGCKFECYDGLMHAMSHHPIVLKGILNKPIVVLDQTITIGMHFLPKTALSKIMEKALIYEKQTVLHDLIKER